MGKLTLVLLGVTLAAIGVSAALAVPLWMLVAFAAVTVVVDAFWCGAALRSKSSTSKGTNMVGTMILCLCMTGITVSSLATTAIVHRQALLSLFR